MHARGLPSAPSVTIKVGGAVDGSPLELAASLERGGRNGLRASVQDASWKSAHLNGELVMESSIADSHGQARLRLGQLSDLDPLLGTDLKGSVDGKMCIRDSDQSLQFAVEARKQDLLAYDESVATTGVTLTRKLNKLWTLSAGVSAAEEQIIQDQPFICLVTTASCTEGDIVPDFVTRDYTLVALPLTVSFDSTELTSPLDDPTHGMRASLSVTPTRSFGQPSATFLIDTIKLATYFDLDHLLPTCLLYTSRCV